jgi:membrane protein implicated in regulation of membrane protease activity
MTPFLATIIFFNWRIYLAQFPILWVLSATYVKRVHSKQEAEAERMAVKMTEKAGFEEVIGGLDERWRCK